MVTSVMPTLSVTDAFLLPPFGSAVSMICENEKWINANESKIANSFFIQRVLECQAKKEKTRVPGFFYQTFIKNYRMYFRRM